MNSPRSWLHPAQSTAEHTPEAGRVDADSFFSAAIPRMMHSILILGSLVTIAVLARFGWSVALGFAAGTLTSYSSFRSLYSAVQSLANRVVASGRPEGGFSLVNGFFLRYVLAGIVAYVIFTSSPWAFRGFLSGLCMPVAAMLLEAAYEAYSAVRRGY